MISSNAITLIPTAQNLLGDGTFTASFLGVPGLVYRVDRATDLSGPWELAFTNLTADLNGVFGLSDRNLPPESRRFYRARYP